MVRDHPPPTIEPSKRAGVFLLVVLVHLFLLYWMAMMRGQPLPPAPILPPMQVVLFPPGGGGAPAGDASATSTVSESAAAASALHVPEETWAWPETVPAPVESGAPDLVLDSGVAVDPAATPGVDSSQGADAAPAPGGGGSGVGTGTGAGRGPGIGPGRGEGGSGAVLIRGPAGATISRNVSPASLASLPGPYAVLRCEIRVDQRLDRCRVLNEHPAGAGVGRAAVRRAREFRFRPPRIGTRFQDRRRITVAIAFPPDGDEAAQP